MRVWAISFYTFFFSANVVSAQFTDKTFDAAYLTLKDGTGKVDSLNKICRTLEDNGKSIACEIKIIKLAEKLNYKKGVAQALNNIGVAYYNLDKGEQALEYHRRALTIRQELLVQAEQNGTPDQIRRYKKDISASYTNAGNAYDGLGDKKKAIEYHTRSLDLGQEIKDTAGMARSYLNIASAYLDLPDYYKAIDYGFKAVKLYYAIGEKSNNLAHALNNVGIGYERLKDFDKALDYYQKALVLQQELGNQDEIAKLLGNIANIYLLQGQLSKDNILKKSKFHAALENYSKSLNILEASDDKSSIALVYNNIGNIYWELNDFSQALSYLNKSLDLYKQLGSQSDIASAMNSLATHFRLQKDFTLSAKYALGALSIADSIHDAEQIKNASEILSGDYFDLKQFEKSLFYYKKYTAEKDTLTNVEGAKNLVQEESRQEYEKREQQLKFEQDKKDAVASAEKRKQQIITWSVIVGMLLVVVFAGFIFRSLRITSKQKSLIEKQKLLVDKQKKQMEEKNKDITDSIHYAKRIQRALLASETVLTKNLPEYFVLYKPKDIVSGDFYWAAFVNGKFLIITADCTGHGVPGAFMSLLNISLLNEITLQRKITQPDLILNNVRDEIIKALHPEGTEEQGQDGMDCILMSFEFQVDGSTLNDKKEFPANAVLQCACANNPLWIAREKQLVEYKADKMPVGFYSEQKPFSLQTIDLQKGDIVYSFTDGYADQFGGPKNKKFRYKQLGEVLLGISDKPMPEQKEILDKTIEDWKGDNEQVDDVLVIGIRI